ncbi:dihydrodipicolinate reductase [Nocardia sp. NPDC057353]|uniref:NAD(P)H-dependent amine dehydrogenase family protein n=1 Tax=Nocardia sp. NPDC057353 TaxID=3346104 RepID=UPI0036285C1F
MTAEPLLPIPTATHRVVQWATGNVGGHALRAVLEHPHLVLCGVLVHDPAKAGLDAAELCGVDGRTGVTATTDVAEALALAPDCVLYMPRLFDPDEVCALLVAGIDVVTTHGELRHPESMDPEVCARIEAACWFGGASVLSTGVAPGFVTETLPVALSSLQRRVRRIGIEESVQLATHGADRLMLEAMGFGGAAREFEPERLAHARRLHAPSLRLLAESLRLPLDRVAVRGEHAVAARDVALAGTVLPAGTVAAQRITVTGVANGRDLLEYRSTWYCTAELEPAWTVRETGWHVAVEGETPVELSLRYPVEPERLAAISPRYAANRAVNAVAYLRAAPPGIRTTRDLPPLVAELGHP